MTNNYKPFYLLLFVLALVVSFAGINNDFFTDDPGLYASIAKSMLHRHDILQLFSYDQDWLDKPHFPFWAAMLSFKIFGISVWAYRLPALLFFLLGLFYTYLFARRFYTREIALTAVLMLMTAEHILISNLDVRAEPYLMALVIGSIYHIARYNDKATIKHLVLAALLTGCAIMTKGIFVIVAIYGSLLGEYLFRRKFIQLFYGKWLLLYLLTFICTLPEFYALYIQFDLHPEKFVFDRHHVSGIRWFLWDSQFGRFANNGPIKQKKSGDIFFAHTLLWAFLPWCILFYYAVYKSVKNIWQKVKLPEYYTISGGLFLLALFSLSRFQLPFYTNILFPLFAIITAPYCFSKLSRTGENIRRISLVLFAVALPLLILVIHIYLKPASGTAMLITGSILFASVAIVILLKVKAKAYKTFMLACCAVLFANFYLVTVFFKTVASYNGQVKAGTYSNRQQFNNAHFYSLSKANNIFQFYSKRSIDYLPIDDFIKLAPRDSAIFFAGQPMLDRFTNEHIPFKIVASFTDYPQENILPAFINSATRNKVLSKVYLITK